MLGREFRRPCDLLFGAPSDKELPTIDHAENLVDHLHDICNHARQHLKLSSGMMKTHYERLATCTGYHEAKQSMALLLNLRKGDISQAPILMGGPVQGSNLDN
jgi:hypothetical protein